MKIEFDEEQMKKAMAAAIEGRNDELSKIISKSVDLNISSMITGQQLGGQMRGQ